MPVEPKKNHISKMYVVAYKSSQMCLSVFPEGTNRHSVTAGLQEGTLFIG